FAEWRRPCGAHLGGLGLPPALFRKENAVSCRGCEAADQPARLGPARSFLEVREVGVVTIVRVCSDRLGCNLVSPLMQRSCGGAVGRGRLGRTQGGASPGARVSAFGGYPVRM